MYLKKNVVLFFLSSFMIWTINAEILRSGIEYALLLKERISRNFHKSSYLASVNLDMHS